MEPDPSDHFKDQTKQSPRWWDFAPMARPEEEPLDNQQLAVIDWANMGVRRRLQTRSDNQPEQEPRTPDIGGGYMGSCRLSRYELLIRVASFTMVVLPPAVMLMAAHNPAENISIRTTAPITPVSKTKGCGKLCS
ncbi:hypothetical protein V1264_015052 [Littorina saxatilis]|uniref:Uncharacterized protein n=1 Tax=Littorina saxatilis TaxID=31220 RepID=A0AAN9GFH7_9CAEN